MPEPEGGQQLRFGVLCDARRLQRWQVKCLEDLARLPGVEPAALLIRSHSGDDPSGRSRAGPGSSDGAGSGPDSRGGQLFRFLEKLEPASPASWAELPAHLTALPVVDLEPSAVVVGIEPSSVAAATALAPECAAAIRSHRLHFILSFSARPAHALIDLARYGVWVFEFGDWERFRGSPPGFWEVYRDAALSGAMLARLTPDPDVVIPLRRGNLRTHPFSYPDNRDQLLRRFTHWPAQVCREILHADGACLQSAPVRGNPAINTTPCNKGVIRFLCRLSWYILTRGVRSWLEQDHWNVGIIEQPIQDFVRPGGARKPIRWLPAPGKGQFFADPFGVVRAGQLTVFCEYLDYRDGIGTIVAIQPSAPAPKPVPVAIGPHPPVHLSYPLVFEHEGRLLCIPETQGAREVTLYGLERFPDRWVKLTRLIDNAAIVDATLFRHGELWWLAGASDPGAAAQLGADLHLWYASDITGPWTPHPDNPVKTDVSSARPAGTPFESEGILYRPAQDSSASYGSRVIINRVHTLTPTAFREEPVGFVEPDVDGPYPDGLHTLSSVGQMTLVDGKRLRLAPAEFRRVIGRMVRRRLRKIRYRLASGGVSPIQQ